MAVRRVAGKTSSLPARLERLVAYLEQTYDVRGLLADAPRLAIVLRRLGFELPSVPFGFAGPRPWYVLLVNPETPPLLRVVLVALVARRPERTPCWPAGTSRRQVEARLRALWLGMLDALDADQLDLWLPLPQRVAWFVRRVAQVYDRHAHVGTRLPRSRSRSRPRAAAASGSVRHASGAPRGRRSAARRFPGLDTALRGPGMSRSLLNAPERRLEEWASMRPPSRCPAFSDRACG
jgi:hypothetical protein